MKKISYLFAMAFIGLILFSCTPENQLTKLNETACCGDDGSLPPPPPPPPPPTGGGD